MRADWAHEKREVTRKKEEVLKEGIGTVVSDMRSFPAVRLFFVLLLLLGCRPSEEAFSPAERKNALLEVAVSVPPQEWLVKQIGGERVEVFSVVPTGASPATYKPTDAEVSRIMRCRLFFRIGVPFEGGPWFHALQAASGLKIYDLREGIELRKMTRHLGAVLTADKRNESRHDVSDDERASVGLDPHIWQSPKLLKTQAETVASALIETDPTGEAGYRKRLALLHKQLDELDEELHQQLEPFAGRPFLVLHPSWGYFADVYRLKQVAIELEGKEPSDAELTWLQRRAEEWGSRTIFVQPQFSSRAAHAVAEIIGGSVVELDPLAADIPNNLREVAAKLTMAYQRDEKRPVIDE